MLPPMNASLQGLSCAPSQPRPALRPAPPAPATAATVAPARAARLAEVVQQLPGIDLHCHLEGAITPEMMVEVARKYDIKLPTYDVEQLRPLMQVTDKDKTLLDFLKKFDTISLAFKSPEAIRDITHRVIENASKENVKYLELRFSPLYMAGCYNLDTHAVMDAVIQGVKDSEKDCDTKTNLIVIMERQMGVDKARQVKDLALEYKAREPRIRALDLANDEFHFPPDPYVGVFKEGEAAGLAHTDHEAEAGPARNAEVSIEQSGSQRIGHGIRVADDPAVEKLVKDRGVTLEMCPTSNLQTGAAADIAHYPMRRFYDEGIKVTVNTDDPAVCGTTLKKEYYRVVTELGFSVPELEHMIMNGVEAAFLTPGERDSLRQQFAAQIARVNEHMGPAA
jgi:adenosine deaminase